MKQIFRILVCLMIALMLIIAQPAYALKVQPCGALPKVIVEDLRNVRGGFQRPDQEFLNNEGKLPAIDRGYLYSEYTLDRNNPNPGNRGQYRAVGRVKIGALTPVNPIYVSKDHYTTFCTAS